jgi:hypothetical protein
MADVGTPAYAPSLQLRIPRDDERLSRIGELWLDLKAE